MLPVFLHLSSSTFQSPCTFSDSDPSALSPSWLPPTRSSHSPPRPRGSGVWLLQELWLISGQVPQVLLLLHLLRLVSQLSFSFSALLTSIFFFYDFSFLPSPTPSQLLFIPLSLSVFLSFFWLMRSVADVNLNQVLRSHKSCKARINSHVTARICFYCAFLSKVCTALWKLPTFLESNIGIVESLSL